MKDYANETMKNFVKSNKNTDVFQNMNTASEKKIIIASDFFSFVDVWKGQHWAEFVVSKTSFNAPNMTKDADLLVPNSEGYWHDFGERKPDTYEISDIVKMIKTRAVQASTGSSYSQCCMGCGKPILSDVNFIE